MIKLILILIYFMENTIFLKLEVITMFISLWYILYYLLEKLYVVYFKVKNIVTPDVKETKNRRGKKMKISSSDNSIKKSDIKLSQSEKDKLSDIIKRAKVNAAKWYFDSCKHLIIEWLAIDKYNKELNLELAGIYEKEHNYKNAEFIYRDLIEAIWKDTTVMKKLWFILALQHELEPSLNIYEKVYKKIKDDTEVLNMLTDITFELHLYDKSLKYVKILLKDKPRNVDRLLLQAVCYENLQKFSDAFDIYKKIVELQPYNTLARNKLNELFALKN